MSTGMGTESGSVDSQMQNGPFGSSHSTPSQSTSPADDSPLDGSSVSAGVAPGNVGIADKGSANTAKTVYTLGSTPKSSTRIDLDKELQFEKAGLSKSGFAAKVIFITIITVVLYSLFIAVFFFVFTAQVEKRVVTKSIKSAVSFFTKDINAVLSSDERAALEQIMSAVQVPDMSSEDKEAKKANAKLQKKTYMVLGTIAGVCVVVVALCYVGLRARARHVKGAASKAGVDYPSMGNVVFIACMGFIGVMVAEFVFLYTVGYFYEPLDNYATTRAILDGLLHFAK